MSLFSIGFGLMNRSATHAVTEFVLLGFPGCWKIQIFLLLFFVIYIFTLLGNGAIICAVRCDPRSHTPMYFLLGNFAFFEIWYISSTVPSMLANILSKTKPSHFLGASSSSISSFHWAQLNVSSWLSWLMIGTWPSAAPCTTLPS
jgi:olfactory receptor